MDDILEKSQTFIIQIATSYSKEGTGFYLKKYDLIVTSEHIVRDHREAIVEAKGIERQMAMVLFIDRKNDLAFLQAPTALQSVAADLTLAEQYELGEQLLAIGQPFGMKFAYASGNLLEKSDYIIHDAALSTDYNGGPLLNLSGDLVGINAFLQQEDTYAGFALPANIIEVTILDFKKGFGKNGSRCIACESIVFESPKNTKYCPNCGSKITMLSEIEDYEPNGVSKTVENILLRTGHPVELSRRGLNNWEIQQGSAKVIISYHEDSGLITGDAYLCFLPKENIQLVLKFLLQQNKQIESLNFSINPNGKEIILSLLIYDRYLNTDTGVKLFQHLFERADYYDNMLVEEYNARWKDDEKIDALKEYIPPMAQ